MLLHGRVRDFLHNIQKLFVDQHCVNTGMTKRMLGEAQKQRMWFDGQSPSYIGKAEGISVEGLALCLRHMSAWVSLCAGVIAAEFPNFETAQAFRVLALSDDGDSTCELDSLDADVARLAQTFQLDEVKLKAQFQTIVGIAKSIRRESRCSIRDAWCDAIRKVNRRASVRRNYESDVLAALLHRYCVWKISSSGVEQNFSVRKLVIGQNRHSLSALRELDELQLRTFHDDGTAAVEMLLMKAQQIWKPLFGACRKSTFRMRGCKRNNTSGDAAMSIAEVLRKRRAEVQALPTPSNPMSASVLAERAKAQSGEVWQDSHKKEERRQKVQRNLRFIESAAQGHMPVEQGSELHAAVGALGDIAQKRRAQRAREAATVSEKLVDHALSFQQQRVYNASSMLAQELGAQMQKLHFRLVDEPADANICIVEDIDTVAKEVTWAMVLRGGSVVQPRYLRTISAGGGSAPGPCITFAAARCIKRRYWLSNGFKREHPVISTIITKCTLGHWGLLGSSREWLQRVADRPRQQMANLGFLTAAESAAVSQKSGLTEEDALKFIMHLAHSKCSQGLLI